jgi:hypothetical protein
MGSYIIYLCDLKRLSSLTESGIAKVSMRPLEPQQSSHPGPSSDPLSSLGRIPSIELGDVFGPLTGLMRS